MIGIDVGNTNIQFAWFKGNKIQKIKYLKTSKAGKASIEKVLGQKLKTEPIVVCSVVPKVTGIFKSLKRDVFVVGKDIKVPIRCFYDKSQVGTDRLLAVYAAKRMHKKARLVLDFGTAITLDFLSKRGDYLGGLILPGLGSTLSVLSACAMLPSKIKVEPSRALIPKNTKESINKGIGEGFSAMINTLVKSYKKRLKMAPDDKIIITGGEASIIMPKLEFRYKYEPDLVLRGLQMLVSSVNLT